MNLRIAFISPSDPKNKDAQSGTIHYIYKTLQKLGDVVFLYPFERRYYFHLKVLNKLSQLLLKKGYNFSFSVKNSKRVGKILTEMLKGNQFDIIFSPYGSMQLAFLETSIPIIYHADSTFQNMIDYYPGFSHFLSKREGNLLEQRAISKAKKLVYYSEWAANSAIRDYGAAPEKVHVLSPGATMDWIPPSSVRKATTTQKCHLLFVGKDWLRKGGDLVVTTLEKLGEFGLQAELTIVGCRPPREIRSKNIRVIPYLNKNRDEEARRLEQLYFETDFFVLPTRADCSSVVTAEANAFGVPVISSNTGGLPSIIKDGINGYLLPLTATGEDFAKVILTVFRDQQSYGKLRETSRREYENRLNWEVWGQGVEKIIDSVMGISRG